MRLHTEDPVWYVAYGSNMSARRFDCYISGGRPLGGRRTYLGGRDQSPPRDSGAIAVAGGLYFSGESKVWGGGIAFYDPHAVGMLAARAYLVTFGQLSDIVAQETWRAVGDDLVLGNGSHRAWPIPSRGYDVLLQVGERDAIPMFTITRAHKPEPTPPTEAYLRTLLDGLAETFDSTVDERAQYLLHAPGVTPTWTADHIASLRPTNAANSSSPRPHHLPRC
jgi:hypothetical protein